MISDIDLVKQAFSYIELGDFEKTAELFSENFRFKGPSLVSLDKQQYLEAHEALVNALPDWKFNPTDWRQEGDLVMVNIHITGTFTRPLRYPFPHMREVSPTNKRIALPEEPTRIAVVSGQIIAIEAETVPGGGIMGVFTQLGIGAPVPV